MQKVFFVFSALLFVFSLSSCEKNLKNLDSLAQQISAADKTDVNVATLPNTITEENYFETYIDKVSLADALGYELSMGNKEIAFFSLTGDYLDEVPRGREHSL